MDSLRVPKSPKLKFRRRPPTEETKRESFRSEEKEISVNEGKKGGDWCHTVI